jgi:phospholipid/cholesterol/gamma-HCH transport system substrate-binding protein
MASRNAEIVVGATVLAALALVVWSVTYLREVRIAEKTHVWTARFSDVGGLAEDDPVTVNGVKKGIVRAIHLGRGQVNVDFILERDVALTSESHVFLRNVGMMGEKFLAIIPGQGPRLLAAGRDTLEGEYESGVPEVVSQMGKALVSLERLSDSVDRVLKLAEEGGRLKNTFANVEAASRDLRLAIADSREQLAAATGEMRGASESGRRILETTEPRVTRAFDDLERNQARFDSLLARVDTLAASLNAVTRKVNTGSSTASRLINEQQLYDDMRVAVREMSALVHEIRTNPQKYFKISVF